MSFALSGRSEDTLVINSSYPLSTLDLSTYFFLSFFIIGSAEALPILQTNKSSKKKFSIVKRVHPRVDLSRSDKVVLSQGGSEAAMLCSSFTFSSFFLVLFLFVGIEHNDV